MSDNKHFSLYCFSWIVTLIAMWFLYAGLHPNAVSSFFIKNYAKTLIILANLPPLIYAANFWYKDKEKLINIFIVIFSVVVQFYILT